MLETAAVLPTQGPFIQPTPVTILTLSALLSLAKAALALVYAAAHVPVPVPGVPVPVDVGAEDVLEAREVVVVTRVDVDGVTGPLLDVVMELRVVVVDTELVDTLPGTHWK
jgi:hypothetical protein